MTKSDKMKIQVYLANNPELYEWVVKSAEDKGLKESSFIRMVLIQLKNGNLVEKKPK